MIVSSHSMERQQWNLMISIALIEYNYFAKRNPITIKCSLLLEMHSKAVSLISSILLLLTGNLFLRQRLFILHGDKLRLILCMDNFIVWRIFIWTLSSTKFEYIDNNIELYLLIQLPAQIVYFQTCIIITFGGVCFVVYEKCIINKWNRRMARQEAYVNTKLPLKWNQGNT